MTRKVLRLPEVIKRTGISRSLIYRLIKEGNFPKQIHTSKRTSSWIESEINDWLDARISESREETEVV